MRKKQIFRTLLLAAAAAAAVWLIVRWLFPFVLGLAAALLVEKPVRFLKKKGASRTVSAVLCVLGLDILLGAGIYLLLRVLLTELNGLARQLPSLAANMAPTLMGLKNALLSIAEKFPDGIGTGLRSGISTLFQSGSLLGQTAYRALFSFASGLLEKAPGIFLFAATAIISGFFVSAELPTIVSFLKKRLPAATVQKSALCAEKLRKTLGCWLLAEVKLMGITFVLLTVGFLLLGVSYPLLAAILITLVDALPVLGTGCVLIPWGIVSFLQGRTLFAVGVLVLYAVTALTRQALEPRLVGRQLGMNPLVTLMAMYVGFRMIGVLGMIFFPIGAILLWQLVDFLPPKTA